MKVGVSLFFHAYLPCYDLMVAHLHSLIKEYDDQYGSVWPTVSPGRYCRGDNINAVQVQMTGVGVEWPSTNSLLGVG